MTPNMARHDAVSWKQVICLLLTFWTLNRLPKKIPTSKKCKIKPEKEIEKQRARKRTTDKLDLLAKLF